MGNIADKLEYLKGTKDLFKETLEEKRGLDLTDIPFRQYPVIMGEELDKGGGAEGEGHLVRFIDYNGDIIKQEYVKSGENATAPTADEMPNHLVETDKHPSLTFDGWNNALTNITENRDIGAVYKTTDGKTWFFVTITPQTTKSLTISFNKVSASGTLYISINGELKHSVTASGVVNGELVFDEYGDYTIQVWTDSGNYEFFSPLFSGGTRRLSALTRVFVGNNIASINYSVFNNCYSLTAITIPNSVESIGSSVFNSCYSLTSIVLPSGLESIGLGVFYNCKSLTAITIPNSVESIGESVFYNCYSLTSIVLPSGLESIGESVFNYCYSLTSIVLPSGLESIGDYVFNYCYSLTSIVLPSGLESIGESVFNSCYSLTDYDIKRAETNTEVLTVASGSVTTSEVVVGYKSGETTGIVSIYAGTTLIAPTHYQMTANNTITFDESVANGTEVTVKYITAITLLNHTSAFTNINAITKIYVPDIAIDVYKNFTNWITYKDYIYPFTSKYYSGYSELISTQWYYEQEFTGVVGAVYILDKIPLITFTEAFTVKVNGSVIENPANSVYRYEWQSSTSEHSIVFHGGYIPSSSDTVEITYLVEEDLPFQFDNYKLIDETITLDLKAEPIDLASITVTVNGQLQLSSDYTYHADLGDFGRIMFDTELFTPQIGDRIQIKYRIANGN